jgi:hypothetical protein
LARRVAPTDQTGLLGLVKSVRWVAPTGQTSLAELGRPKILKPKNPEVDKYKMIKTKVHGKMVNFKPAFD